jgi:hypothetical protein
MIQEIEGMPALYPGTCNFSNATKLRSLEIGSSAEGYFNTYLSLLNVDNNTLLEYLYA